MVSKSRRAPQPREKGAKFFRASKLAQRIYNNFFRPIVEELLAQHASSPKNHTAQTALETLFAIEQRKVGFARTTKTILLKSGFKIPAETNVVYRLDSRTPAICELEELETDKIHVMDAVEFKRVLSFLTDLREEDDDIN